MKKLDITVLSGLVLIVLGGLFLIESLGIARGILPLLFVLLFAVSGIVFLYFYWINRDHWWALIPGFSSLGIGALIGLTTYGPKGVESLGVVILLGSIGLSFWTIYLVNREHWWSIIPGGVLLSVAMIVGLDAVLEKDDIIGSVFLLGLALTFGLLAVLPTPTGRMKWAWIPAGILFVISLIAFPIAVSRYVWPVAIIAIGLWILYRAMFRRSKIQEKLENQPSTEIESGEVKEISSQP